MVTVLLVLAVFIGLVILISVACERELLGSEREEQPQRRKALTACQVADEEWRRDTPKMCYRS
jgi:hypothetical protein